MAAGNLRFVNTVTEQQGAASDKLVARWQQFTAAILSIISTSSVVCNCRKLDAADFHYAKGISRSIKNGRTEQNNSIPVIRY